MHVCMNHNNRPQAIANKNFPRGIFFLFPLFKESEENGIDRHIFSRLLAIKSNNGAIDDQKKRRNSQLTHEGGGGEK